MKRRYLAVLPVVLFAFTSCGTDHSGKTTPDLQNASQLSGDDRVVSKSDIYYSPAQRRADIKKAWEESHIGQMKDGYLLITVAELDAGNCNDGWFCSDVSNEFALYFNVQSNDYWGEKAKVDLDGRIRIDADMGTKVAPETTRAKTIVVPVRKLIRQLTELDAGPNFTAVYFDLYEIDGPLSSTYSHDSFGFSFESLKVGESYQETATPHIDAKTKLSVTLKAELVKELPDYLKPRDRSIDWSKIDRPMGSEKL